MNEWRDIPGYEGFYQVSDNGLVRSISRSIVRSNGMPQSFKPRIIRSRNRRGYRVVTLAVRGVISHLLVHRAVALTFIGPSEPGRPHVAHWDGDKANNHVGNLRYATPAENNFDQIRLGKSRPGEASHLSKLTEDDVRTIRARYSRESTCVSNTRALAAEFGVTPSLILQIMRREIWAHI